MPEELAIVQVEQKGEVGRGQVREITAADARRLPHEIVVHRAKSFRAGVGRKWHSDEQAFQGVGVQRRR